MTSTALVLAMTLAACAGPAFAGGTLHVTEHDHATAAVVDLARPEAIAFEERLRDHPLTGDDVMFQRSLEVGSLSLVEYRNRHILDGGTSWCWVDVAGHRAGCAEWGASVLVTVVRMLAPATPIDADFAVLVSMLASGQRGGSGARVDRRRDGVHVDYAVDTFDEARGKRERVDQRVWITADGDVLVAEVQRASGAVPPRGVLAFEGKRVGKGYVTPATLAPLRARSAEFMNCFAAETDGYPVVDLDITLDAHDRIASLAASGVRVSIDTTACVVALVRATAFDSRADREARLSINRHAP
jgi:hypothetical protein